MKIGTQMDQKEKATQKMKAEKAEAADDNYKSIKNIILKGSKLTGDIRLNNDLELLGEVEGNIISEGELNIIIKVETNE